MAHNGNKTAFPSHGWSYGLSKREYVALSILTSWCTNPDDRPALLLVKESVQVADALLDELDRTHVENES